MKTFKHLNIKTYSLLKTGFTLIELLVTVGIIILLMAAAIPSYNRYGAQNELYQVTQTVRTAILTAKNYAVAPSSEKSNLEYYSISFSNANGKLQYIINEKSASGIREIESSQFSDITCSVVPEIQFSVADKGKIISPLGNFTITLTSSRASAPNNVFNVNVDVNSGQVNIIKPTAAPK